MIWTSRATWLAIACATATLLGCRSRKNVAEHILADPAQGLATARCGGAGQIVRPLIIEWPATDRASLESRLRRGLVVIRYDSCVVEVLRDCAAPEGAYDYLGITRKNDRLAIRTADELYFNMPLTAVKLEAKLEKAGELNVEMALVGNYEAQRARFDISELQGRCQGATHVIAAAQVGAFEFYTGAAAELSAGVEVENVAGAGGASTASREILNRDGDASACERSTPNDSAPPAECGALLRLELSALDGIAPTCQPGSVWNGSACVTTQRAEAEAQQERDAAKAQAQQEREAAKAAKKSENEEIAWQLCAIQMQCEAESSGMLPPEGDAYQRQMRACTGITKIMINDYTRPQARKCIADAPTMGCAAFETCVTGPEDEPDPDWDTDLDSDW
ncbi:hypothetical protein ENSA5_27910 [Enhygromyxa salina]|uniref:Lipoprotein n=1 Tax=Enhygromyxa salina TaxID=215803 RepID=A0A2S9Y681_9BACT|nr:hypothetical protein [Enhygromyxa salina]PRQ00610.1 hypothetical protein ENSA5_27910 [Enhygromyxa salina]